MSIRRSIRSVDTAARLGGDEFCVLAPSRIRKSAATLGERLAAAVRDEVATPDEPPLGLSIGVAACPEHGTDAEALIEVADRAMYKAKAAGDGVALGEPVEEPAERRSPRRPLAAPGRARYSISPWRMPIATAWVRVEAASFARSACVGVRTVSVERPSCLATMSVCIPSASICRISRCRVLRVRSPSSSTIVEESPGST